MKNHKLYIQPNWDAPQKKRELDVALHGVSEFHDVIFDVDKRKFKSEDVPPIYRRNRKQDALDVAVIIASVLAIINGILFFVSL
jgi:hypothetical protein